MVTQCDHDDDNICPPLQARLYQTGLAPIIGRILFFISADSTVLQCGNFEVEEGEDCDAGFLGVLGRDRCCNSTCGYSEGAVCRCVCVCEV